MDPATIAMLVSTGAELLGLTPPDAPQVQPGGGGVFNPQAQTQSFMPETQVLGGGPNMTPVPKPVNKYTSTIRNMNEGETKGFGLGLADEGGMSDEFSLGLEAAAPDTTSKFAEASKAGFPGGEGEGGGLGKTMEYAALAAQLGSMFAGSPAPPPPSGGRGGSFDFKPFNTMRGAYG